MFKRARGESVEEALYFVVLVLRKGKGLWGRWGHAECVPGVVLHDRGSIFLDFSL